MPALARPVCFLALARPSPVHCAPGGLVPCLWRAQARRLSSLSASQAGLPVAWLCLALALALAGAKPWPSPSSPARQPARPCPAEAFPSLALALPAGTSPWPCLPFAWPQGMALCSRPALPLSSALVRGRGLACLMPKAWPASPGLALAWPLAVGHSPLCPFAGPSLGPLR